MLDVGDSHVEVKSDLYNLWKTWCEANGRRNPGTSSSFLNALRTCLPSVREGPRPGNGTDPARRRTVKGVRIKPDRRGAMFGDIPEE
jgi:phage/plasmid-associated DNA primase